MDTRSLKEQLTECVEDVDAVVKQILENLLVEKKSDKVTASEKLSSLVDLFQQRLNDYGKQLKLVENHREREEYIRELEKCVQTRDSLIKKIASELKYMELALTEATYQAEKKLKSVRESETNRAFSEDVIRLAHQISKSHSVATSMYWQQGDPGRPFPTEADFAVSALQLNRINQQNQPGGSAFMRQSSVSGGGLSRTASSGALGNLRGSPMSSMMMNSTLNSTYVSTPGGQKPFSPSPRSGIFGQGGMVGAQGPLGGSPGSRGRSSQLPSGTGAGARMPSPSARSIHPTILQRAGRPTSQSPRNSMSGSLSQPGMVMQTSPAMSGGSSHSTPYGYMGNQQSSAGGLTINLPPSLMSSGPSKSNSAQQLDKVEQMSSDSSSSSSSGDEASPENM